MSTFRARPMAAALGIAPDEPDQVIRLGRFREEHPEVIIGDGGFGTWQARIPESHGETVITRYTLRELRDKLGELMGRRRRTVRRDARLRTVRRQVLSDARPGQWLGWGRLWVLTNQPGVLTYATVPLMCPAAFPYFVPAQVSGAGWVSRPVGRVLCARLRGAAVIHLGLPLPTASCGLPASIGRAALDRSRREPLAPLLTLLRVGFTEPPQSPAALVVSYTTVSPLPRLTPGRFAFCGTVPRVTPGRRYRPPCPVEPGPSSPGLRPARPPGRLTRAQDTPDATGPA